MIDVRICSVGGRGQMPAEARQPYWGARNHGRNAASQSRSGINRYVVPTAEYSRAPFSSGEILHGHQNSWVLVRNSWTSLSDYHTQIICGVESFIGLVGTLGVGRRTSASVAQWSQRTRLHAKPHGLRLGAARLSYYPDLTRFGRAGRLMPSTW